MPRGRYGLECANCRGFIAPENMARVKILGNDVVFCDCPSCYGQAAVHGADAVIMASFPGVVELDGPAFALVSAMRDLQFQPHGLFTANEWLWAQDRIRGTAE